MASANTDKKEQSSVWNEDNDNKDTNKSSSDRMSTMGGSNNRSNDDKHADAQAHGSVNNSSNANSNDNPATQQQQQQQPQQHRIQIQLGPEKKRKRKRKRVLSSSGGAALSGSSSSSSSSSSSDEEAPTTTTVATTTTTASTSSSSCTTLEPTSSSSTPSSSLKGMQQPQGWRVKLYRLNSDGSWDDCGTGRIVCLYKNVSSDTHTDTTTIPQEDARVYQELGGEPILCMQAEIPPNTSLPHTSRTLLQSRILLRGAYQRQGDNIITWCEPNYILSMEERNEHNNDAPAAANSSSGTNSDNKDASGNELPQQQQGGVDLALSFQDNAGCLDIWRQITNFQSRVGEWFRSHGMMLHPPPPPDHNRDESSPQPQHFQQQQQQHNHDYNGSGGMSSSSQQQHQETQPSQQDNNNNSSSSSSVTADMARAVAAAHHASLQRQQQHALWVNVASEAAQQQQQQHRLEQPQPQQQQHGALAMSSSFEESDGGDDGGGDFREADAEAVAVSMAAAAAAAYGGGGQQQQQDPQQQQSLWANNNNNNTSTTTTPQLPHFPTLVNLEEIADTIAAAQLHQRDALAYFISQKDCSYLSLLLQLFPSAENKGDYGALATLAACIKTILLLNDPAIIEWIVASPVCFENVCSALEYDPDLRDKANHRWFLRERAKFRTVVHMEDEELISTIHRSFRVTYLRDTLLRPTMDESSLSTLSSLQTFTHADVVKGVTVSPRFGHGKESSEAGKDRDDSKNEPNDSYLVQIIRVLGKEVRAIARMEWEELETKFSSGNDGNSVEGAILSSKEEEPPSSSPEPMTLSDQTKSSQQDDSTATTTTPTATTSWKQHLAPQDGSLASRKIRRLGCLSFLRELFSMVRCSLLHSDKDDFYAVIVSMDVELAPNSKKGEKETSVGEKVSANAEKDVKTGNRAGEQGNKSGNSLPEERNRSQPKNASVDARTEAPVNLLSLLGTVLSDPTTDVSEKGAVLEIIAAIALHDSSHIRRHCLTLHEVWKEEREKSTTNEEGGMTGPGRPTPNDRRQVIFRCPPNDLLLSLLFLLAVETDAGLLLQAAEIMRIILDTEMMGDHGPLGTGLGGEDSEGFLPGGMHSPMEQLYGPLGGSGGTGSDQNQFLAMFYEYYVQWLVAPFQFSILHPVRVIPDSVLSSSSPSPLMLKIQDTFKSDVVGQNDLLRIVPLDVIRVSFAVELLSFCVRAHLHRTKFFLLRSCVLGSVMKLMAPSSSSFVSSGDRSLKLAVLRFLRAILSVKDEFYHRHIIQHNLFAPVFEAFRANPVGDNLVSSAVIEMCDYIHSQNIKSLVEYIATKFLMTSNSSSSPTSTTGQDEPSLEDVATPYVNTLTILRRTYEENKNVTDKTAAEGGGLEDQNHPANGHASRYFSGMARPRVGMSEKALEDQRKFREADEEESYFDTDDDDDDQLLQQQLPGVVIRGAVESELHRTPRMFSLAQAPLLEHSNNDPPIQPGTEVSEDSKNEVHVGVGGNDSSQSSPSDAVSGERERQGQK